MVQLQSDGTPFKPGQLFDPLTFTNQQLGMLTNVPGQSLSATNTPAQLLAAQKLSPNIPASKLTPTTPVGVTNPTTGADTAGAMVAGATQGVRTFNDYLAMTTPPETDASRRATTVEGEINTLLTASGGRGQAQVDAEASAGLPGMRGQLADVNAQILSRTAAYNKLYTTLEGQPISMNSIIGGQAQIRKAEAAEIGLLNALSLGLQGQVAAAQDTVNRAIDLKYDDIETQIETRKYQLDLIRDTLDDEERRRADAMELYLNDQRTASDEKKANEKTFQNAKISAISEGMSANTAQRAEALFNQGREDEAYALMSQWTGTASSDGRGGGAGTGVGTSGFQNQKVESEIRDLAVTLTDDVSIQGGGLTVEEAYAKLRRLYSRTEASDEALKEILGMSAGGGGTNTEATSGDTRYEDVFGKGVFAKISLSQRIAQLDASSPMTSNVLRRDYLRQQLISSGYPADRVNEATKTASDRAGDSLRNVVSGISSFFKGFSD